MDGSTVKWVRVDDFKVREDAKRFELYEKNRALTLGLGRAVEYALNVGPDRIWQRVQYLAELLRQKLGNIDGVSVHDIGDQKCGIVTFSVEGLESRSVKSMLAEKNINVSVGMAQSTLIYMNKNNLNSVVRASVHYYNTEDEIKKLCDTLVSITKSSHTAMEQ
jgi:selenocysteine lyase/cysteine desulfurase